MTRDKAVVRLDRKPQDAAYTRELGQTNIAKLWATEPEIAEPKRAVRLDRVDFGQQPGGIRVGCKELDDRERIAIRSVGSRLPVG